MYRSVFVMLALLASCGEISTTPSSEATNALNFLATNGHITAQTSVFEKGEARDASCQGRLCSAFGVESVSSDIIVEYFIDVKIEDVPQAKALLEDPRPIYLLVDHKLRHTIRQSGRTRVEDQTLRRVGAISCANEPYMYVLLPDLDYRSVVEGKAEITVKRTYAPGSVQDSFETTNVEGTSSPILRASFEPFRAGRENCWEPTFKSWRP